MMKSMTGFGRSDFRDDQYDLAIEIKTINHRYRDFFLKTPKLLNPIEEKMKSLISKKVARGRIEVFVKFNELDGKNRKIVYDEELARQYLAVLNNIKRLDSMISDEIDLPLISKFPDVIMVEENPADEDVIYSIIEPVLAQALEKLDNSRTHEGENLKADIISRNEIIIGCIEKIEELSPVMLEKYRRDLKERIASYTESLEIDEKRILTEVAIMADKLNIDEELTRLKSHTSRLALILKEDEPVGRKLDFLIQEINREINTIGSKANDLSITNLVVDVKSEIEKIREQIQNIE
ncbi:YicC/YloC family endoribonuclease [Eubacteriaceae bacterium ES2]|nr:YicC/YloC family endoribonuclease [Eubacteriaceae bacterium ES2]